ncbi:MAG: chorismate mutase [Nanoarchaeota archaeon]|nr:chorismate mutase [Nanoarchaeota archaeon]
MVMLTLNHERKKIDSIDKRILSLLSKRISIGKKIGAIKKSKGLRITDRERERDVIDHAKRMTRDTGLDEKFVENLFKDIIKYTKSKQK